MHSVPIWSDMESIRGQKMLDESPQAALRAARLECLSDMEQYFGDEGNGGHEIISFRNEAAALSLILQRLSSGDGGACFARSLFCTSYAPYVTSSGVLLLGRASPS